MIQDFADWLVYGIFGLSAGTSLGTAVNFFFYDTVKILILLFFISVLMGIVNAYFPIERLRNYLVTHRMYGLQYLLAALFGAITPFCSCSSIPLFIGFVKGGILLIGIGIGAFMHGFVPEGFFEQYMSKDNWLAVPLSVLLAVPMYANAAGIVPVIEVFVAKGIPMGTAIAFMMAVVGLSLPEATLLKKVMTWRLIGIFFGTVAFFIILSGYLFNFIL